MPSKLVVVVMLLGALLMLSTTRGQAGEESQESVSGYERLKQLYREKIGSFDAPDQTASEAGYFDSRIDAIKKYYRESTDSTSEMSKEAYEWLQDDIEKIGAWDYDIFSAQDIDKENVQETLAAMGQERWELVSAVSDGDAIVFILKRAKKSYVKVLPAQDVIKLMSEMGLTDDSDESAE